MTERPRKSRGPGYSPLCIVLTLSAITASLRAMADEPLTKLVAGHGLAFSPDGKVLAVGHEKGVDLWDLKTKKLTATLPSSETIFAIAFSPDSSLLVGGGLVADRGSKPPTAVGHVFLWDALHKQLQAKAECDKETAIGVAFLAGGDQIIAGGEKLALYDRHKLERVAVFPDWRGPFTALDRAKRFVAVHRDFGYAVVDVTDRNTLERVVGFDGNGGIVNGSEIKNPKNSKLSAAWNNPTYRWLFPRDLAVTRDGRLLAGPSNSGAEVFDLIARKKLDPITTPDKTGTTSLVFSPDGTKVALGSIDHDRIVLWDLLASKTITTFTSKDPYILDLCFSPDGTLLASLSMYPVGGDDTKNAYASLVELWGIKK